MSAVESSSLWRGMSIDDMTREELIEAMKQMVRLYELHLAEMMRSLDVLSGRFP